ncbi:MAG: glycosyl transferase family 2 [Parcubacteria group bacterium Gr01-1014_20]|nr:MAG: glycosyl transferase family 2 [Parcubacteria group bacterium Gr01-1014_20]
MQPKVTVLIATHNRVQFVSRAIESVLTQTFKDWELIVADDGSTDETEKVVLGLAEKDSRIKYLKGPHFGRIAKISNFGLKEATGEYIAILDDDDYWIDPQKLAKQVRFLDENKDYVGCGGGFVVADKNGEEKIKSFKPEKDEDIKKNALVANPIVNATSVFRFALAKKIGLYDESMLQFADWEFWLKIGLKGKLYNFQEYFTKYQMWEGGMSFSRQKEAASSAIRIVDRYRKLYPRYPKALLFVCSYYLYTQLPDAIKKTLNPVLSRIKKVVFSS